MIYFDNSATSFPKPQNVIRGTTYALKHLSFNSGRGGYNESIRTADAIYDVREKIGKMFGATAENVIFTKNCTEALNIAIKGSVNKGDHIIISDLEHNSVSRVVDTLKRDGYIQYDMARHSFDDEEIIKNFEELIKNNTRLIVCTHSSNAFGVTFPIKRIGELCKRHGIRFVVDGAQGAGCADIDMKRDCIDILCAPGHKSMYGNMGTGFMAIGNDIELKPLMEGGTGSSSLLLEQPKFNPDRLEAGTLNNSGIISIGEGIDYINAVGRDKIYRHEMDYAKFIYKRLYEIDGIKLYTPIPETYRNAPIVSFNLKDYNSERVASELAKNDICVRGGYQCSPLAHKHFGTTDIGVVRISPGCFNTDRDCAKLINVIKSL